MSPIRLVPSDDHLVQLQLHLFGLRGQPRQRRLDRVHPLQGIAARSPGWRRPG